MEIGETLYVIDRDGFRSSAALGGGLLVAAMVVSALSKLELATAFRKEVLPV